MLVSGVNLPQLLSLYLDIVSAINNIISSMQEYDFKGMQFKLWKYANILVLQFLCMLACEINTNILCSIAVGRMSVQNLPN